MSRNIYEPTTERRVTHNRGQIKITKQRPGAFRWWEPECTAGDGDCTGDEPALENNWDQAPTGKQRFAFRKHADGSLEFRGHLDAGGGATSGTVAVTLPGANAGEVNFLSGLDGDQFGHTIITDDGGTSFQMAMFMIDATTGAVTITWPAS